MKNLYFVEQYVLFISRTKLSKVLMNRKYFKHRHAFNMASSDLWNM